MVQAAKRDADRLLRVGVVGVGVMGSNHARVYADLPGVRLVGVADPDGKQRDFVSRALGCAAFSGVEPLLAQGVDAVTIAAPTHLHRELALCCIERLCGHADRTVDYTNIPGCTYTDPGVASVGLTEKAAREAGHEVRIGKFPFIASGRAIASDASRTLASATSPPRSCLEWHRCALLWPPDRNSFLRLPQQPRTRTGAFPARAVLLSRCRWRSVWCCFWAERFLFERFEILRTHLWACELTG